MRTLLTNCPNCGGVLSGNKCEYCGTNVRYANEVDIDFEGSGVELILNIKQGDSVTVLPLVGRINTVRVSDDYCSFHSDGYAAMNYCIAERIVEFNFVGAINSDLLGNEGRC